MQALWKAVKAWQILTFGSDGSHSPKNTLLKLREEVEEAIADPWERSEYADLLIMLFAAARQAGMNLEDLEEATWGKLFINMERKWRRGESGMYQHEEGT